MPVDNLFSHCCIVFDLVARSISRTTSNPTSFTFDSTHTVGLTTSAAASFLSSIVRCPGNGNIGNSAVALTPTTNLLYVTGSGPVLSFNTLSFPLQLNSDTLTTRSTEISFQQQYRPQLNHPWINPLLRRHSLHVPQYNIPTTRHGPIGMTRLHRHRRRLERRHTQECL